MPESNINLSPLRININRLQQRIDRLAEIGALEGGGVCRLALSDEDRQGRDLVCQWMRELGRPSATRVPLTTMLASGAK